jgi:hypothetical protein
VAGLDFGHRVGRPAEVPHDAPQRLGCSYNLDRALHDHAVHATAADAATIRPVQHANGELVKTGLDNLAPLRRGFSLGQRRQRSALLRSLFLLLEA